MKKELHEENGYIYTEPEIIKIKHSKKTLSISVGIPKDLDELSFYENIKQIYRIIDHKKYDEIEKEIQEREDLKDRRIETSIQYRPRKISHLIIIEAPLSGNEFFYFDELNENDFLFKNLMTAIYGHYDKKAKREYLEDFKKDGYYVISFLDYPIESYNIYKKGKEYLIFKDKINEYLFREKMFELKRELRLNKPTKIILIDANTICYFPRDFFPDENIVNSKKLIQSPRSIKNNRFIREIKQVI